jgi:hypothetical protein
MQPREGDGAGKRNLDGVVPELMELITTLSADQQRSFLGILSKASVGPPKKRSRLQQVKQPAESLDPPCKSKQQGTSTVPAAITTNVGVGDVRAEVDSGTLAPHLHRDTTGTFRIAFHYSADVRQKTVAWIQANCGNAYSRPVINMWESGSQEWTRHTDCSKVL